MFLLKVNEIKPIPYLHEVLSYLIGDGNISYVSFFVVKKGHFQEEIAQRLYDHADKVALLDLDCKKIIVVIYNSPLEEKTLIAHNYEKLNKKFRWELYPGIEKDCSIYSYDVLIEERK